MDPGLKGKGDSLIFSPDYQGLSFRICILLTRLQMSLGSSVPLHSCRLPTQAGGAVALINQSIAWIRLRVQHIFLRFRISAICLF